MKDVMTIMKKTMFGTFAVLFGIMTSASLSVAADTCTPPSAVGVNRPVGADAGTYTFDCTTGNWENSYYSYNPATRIITPLYTVVYTYNPTTSLYDYPDWIFNAPNNNYTEVTQSVAQPPSGADIVGAPAPPPTPNRSIWLGSSPRSTTCRAAGSAGTSSPPGWQQRPATTAAKARAAMPNATNARKSICGS